MKKYELTEEAIASGKKLYLIRALRDFGCVKAGSYGGWVESEENLSQEGDCWICDNAIVCDKAVVSGNGMVGQNACACDEARVYDDAVVYMDAQIRGSAKVHGRANVFGSAYICGNADIHGDAQIGLSATVGGNAEVFGSAEIIGEAIITKNAHVQRKTDVFCVQGLGEKNSAATFFLCKDNRIRVKIGILVYTLDTFKETVKKSYGDSFYAQAAYMAIKAAKVQIVGGFKLERKKQRQKAVSPYADADESQTNAFPAGQKEITMFSLVRGNVRV